MYSKAWAREHRSWPIWRRETAFTILWGPWAVLLSFVKEDIEELKKKKILFVAGGVGAAPVYPQVKWLHERGISADVIVGCKTKSLLFWKRK